MIFVEQIHQAYKVFGASGQPVDFKDKDVLDIALDYIRDKPVDLRPCGNILTADTFIYINVV